MLYNQFSLIHTSEPVIPRFPVEINQGFTNDTEILDRFEKWWDSKEAFQSRQIPSPELLMQFTGESTRRIFTDYQNTNVVYSPVNLWFCLELLSSITDGSSRAQITKYLAPEAAENTAAQDDAIYKALYWDDGFSIFRPTSSLWLGQSTHMAEALLTKISEHHHTSVFQGPMGALEYDEAFRAWLNEMTGGMMEDTVAGLGFEPDNNLALCTALYMRCLWSSPFNRELTHPDVFYGTAGESTAQFMQKKEEGIAYLGLQFSAAIIDFRDGGHVAFVLPNAEISIDDLLQSDEVFEFLFAGREWEDGKYGSLNIAIPQIDICSSVPLKELLAQMGITDVFDADKAMFVSDIKSDADLTLSSIQQYSRLAMNEDGVEASSITVTESVSLLIPSEEVIDFVFNRPFLFAVFSEANIPLFIGVYNFP